MPGFALLRGTTFSWDGTDFRIDRLQPNGDLLLERLEDGQFMSTRRQRLLSDYAEGRVSVRSQAVTILSANTPPIYSRALDELPAHIQAELARRWHYVQSLLESDGIAFTPLAMKPFIAAVAHRIGDATPPSVTSLYRWYSRYRCHQDRRVLIPRSDRRGSRNLRQDSEMLRLVAEAMQEAINASPRATVPTIYVYLIKKIEQENRKRLPAEQLKRPVLRTVYRMLARADVYEHVALREGKNVADRRLRLNKAGVQCNRILERVEIDHTPLDLFLIDERTWLPLGRPTLTVVVDHFSRMLLGYHVSFDSPSAAAVMAALRHAILPKTAAVPALANISTTQEWPCYGRPDVLVVDNGLEFHGRDLESVCFDLDIRIQYCPKHQPRFKGVVERYLKTINYFLAHQLPGTSFARMHHRGDYDPLKHAVLTLAEFKHIFEKWVIDIYAQQIHRSLGVTPWHKWEEGLRHRTPGLPADFRDLQRRIGLTEERSLRRDGIWLHGIRYCGDELQNILARCGEGVRVRVLFDPEDLGVIQVWGPQQESPISVLAADQNYARNLTLRQNDLIRAQLREQGEATENKGALERAKYELDAAVQKLMQSRKQGHRRKAAAIRGISSSNPQSDVQLVPARPVVPARSSITASDDDPPTARYASFSVKR